MQTGYPKNVQLRTRVTVVLSFIVVFVCRALVFASQLSFDPVFALWAVSP